jgi:hypothetical protein
MKLYHGTTLDRWALIQKHGLNAGSFASERAFALMWQGLDSVVIEVEISDKVYYRGIRVEHGLQCQQFELAEGVVIPPHELRQVPDEELIEDRKYLESLSVSNFKRRS